ncbi:hypothetical protein LAZ67_14001774 [Cordylochernes scorpioides]|uniref:Uncharacterized protein n=1 Tax=Cordylochernes scorpioides TaxID=51811 RepID=A0ABY6L6C3_9ARAC|nr:hypothetical protein LAZ67_14001774 [Cordylochernes scorpioides]
MLKATSRRRQTEATSFDKPYIERFPRQQENNQRPSFLTEQSSHNCKLKETTLTLSSSSQLDPNKWILANFPYGCEDPDEVTNVAMYRLMSRIVSCFIEVLSSEGIFIRSIDQNPTLGNYQKLQYLNSALKGNAAGLIRALNISDENYPSAWQTLVNRFDKKSELAFKQIQNLYDLKNVKQKSTKDLLDLLDNCNESIQNLSNLGLERNNLSDMILIHIIQSKLSFNKKGMADEFA